MPVSDAKEMILRTSAKELLKYRPSWLKDCVRISVSAQDRLNIVKDIIKELE